jgi:hypothetical protein
MRRIASREGATRLIPGLVTACAVMAAPGRAHADAPPARDPVFWTLTGLSAAGFVAGGVTYVLGQQSQARYLRTSPTMAPGMSLAEAVAAERERANTFYRASAMALLGGLGLGLGALGWRLIGPERAPPLTVVADPSGVAVAGRF